MMDPNTNFLLENRRQVTFPSYGALRGLNREDHFCVRAFWVQPSHGFALHSAPLESTCLASSESLGLPFIGCFHKYPSPEKVKQPPSSQLSSLVA